MAFRIELPSRSCPPYHQSGCTSQQFPLIVFLFCGTLPTFRQGTFVRPVSPQASFCSPLCFPVYWAGSWCSPWVSLCWLMDLGSWGALGQPFYGTWLSFCLTRRTESFPISLMPIFFPLLFISHNFFFPPRGSHTLKDMTWKFAFVPPLSVKSVSLSTLVPTVSKPSEVLCGVRFFSCFFSLHLVSDFGLTPSCLFFFCRLKIAPDLGTVF